MKLNIETKFDKNDIFYAVIDCGKYVTAFYSELAKEQHIRLANATSKEEEKRIKEDYRLISPCVEMHMVSDLRIDGDGNVFYEDESGAYWKETSMYTLLELDKALNFMLQKLKENEGKITNLLNEMKNILKNDKED